MASFGIENLRASVIDGRFDNVRYRQNELQSLHKVLRNNVDRLTSAISEDFFGHVRKIDTEVLCVFYLASDVIRRSYQTLNFKESISNEYKVANGIDFLSRKIGKGLVVIRPTTHTRFYSVICPIAIAIAAGNCVCLELGDTTSKVDSILKELLPQALNNDTFYISPRNLVDSSILESALLVDQTSNSSTSTINKLVSKSSDRTVAVVDRTADIESAAESIVTARFSFQGTSAYSPDLVIVNEFVKSDFIEACTRYASKFFSSNSSSQSRQNDGISATKKALKDAENKKQITTFGSNNFVLVDVVDRASTITEIKISGCHLLIMGTTSLVDAIMTQKSKSPLLALYIFSDLSTAKFLAQHFNASTSYVNHIPLHLLVGPAAPSTQLPIPAFHKYSVEMFSSPCPQYIALPPEDLFLLDKVLAGGSEANELFERIRKMAVKALPETGQAPGHAIGFFEQGILLGAGLFLSAVVPALGYISWVGGRSAWGIIWRLWAGRA
ncbi:putative aldehyde dehydrogenase protein [Botrytis fragariae]|uniref:Putative aldehyde dehydrogenase protein n=1 Tax=Botrytis fragariae TaxID=1964551 RepID=A0A8H6ANB8_9HELO|nr:putative aldehyde dehydrogenase protein [Botrytis fragariae]KAF5870410.1 putative aldehyde dehydrogenase protein [Botrytis fragariae]